MKHAIVLPLLILSAAAAAADTPAPASVKLPLSEYQHLRDAADERSRHPKPEPGAPTIESARLTVTPGDESVEVASRLEVNVPAAGGPRLPIPAAGRLASWESEPAGVAIVSDGSGRFLAASRPGRYVVTSIEAFPLTPLDGYSRCEIAAPPASAVALVVRLGSADEDVRIGEGALERGANNVFTGTIPPGRNVILDFRARESQVEAARFTAAQIDVVTLDNDNPTREGAADVTVLAGKLARIALAIPAAEKVESVAGDGVAKFERDAEKPDRVVVTIAPPAGGRIRLWWRTTLPAVPAAVSPSVIEGGDGGETYLGAVAERGREIDVRSASGLERADPRDLPPLLRAVLPDRAALVFRSTPGAKERTLAVAAKPVIEAAGRDAVIERATVTSVLTRDGARLDRIVATARTKNPSLPWPVPDGASIWSVFVNGKPVKPSGEGAATKIPLRGSSGISEVDVVVSRPGIRLDKRGETDIALFPLPVPILELSWNVYMPDGKRYRVRDGNVWNAAEELAEDFVPTAAPAPPPELRAPIVVAGAGVGNVFGRVTDEQGGQLPGVTTTLFGCGKPQSTTTDSSGDFYFLNLMPCRYAVKTELSGFATTEHNNVVVRAGMNTRVSTALKIASVATTITVTSESPVLDTGRQSSGTTFSMDEMTGSHGVEGGVPGGVAGGVSQGDLKSIPTARDAWNSMPKKAQRTYATGAAAVAQQVQQGLKSLPIDIPSEGKVIRLEGRLFLGDTPTVRVQYRDGKDR